MEESVNLHEEAGKENKQMLANLSLPEEVTSKDEVEIEKFLQEQKSKNTQYKTKSDLNAWRKFWKSHWKSLEQLKTYLPMSLTFFCPKIFISVDRQNGTEYEPGTLIGFQEHKQKEIWKASTATIQHLWSDSEKCLLSWIVSQVHPLSPKKTKSVPPLQHSKMSSQSNKSSLRQFLPERILTILKAEHLSSTFSVVISRRSQDWMRTDHWAMEAQTGITYILVALLVTFHKVWFQPQAFSLSLYEKFCLHSLTKFVQSWTYVLFRLETSDRRKPAKCLGPRMEANKIIYVFVPLLSCFAI